MITFRLPRSFSEEILTPNSMEDLQIPGSYKRVFTVWYLITLRFIKSMRIGSDLKATVYASLLYAILIFPAIQSIPHNNRFKISLSIY